VIVIRDRFQVVERVGVEVAARLPLVAASLDDVKCVGDDAGGYESLAVIVKINSPWVACAVREDFELVADGVISPDPGIYRDPLVNRGSWSSDAAVREYPLATVEPAVGSPVQGVQDLMSVLKPPAVQ